MISKIKLFSRKGFSILELITAIGIFSFLTIFLFSGIITVRNIWLKSSAKIKLVDEGMNALSVMKSELAQSGRDYFKITNSASDYCANNDTNTGSLIIFPVPILISGKYHDINGSINWGYDGDTNKKIRYRVYDNKLFREIADTSSSSCDTIESKVLAYNMDSDSPVTFEYDTGSHTIALTINLEDRDFASNEVDLSLEEIIYPEN